MSLLSTYLLCRFNCNFIDTLVQFFNHFVIIVPLNFCLLFAAHQSVFSRPQEDRNKAVPIPMKTSPAPPQQTTVNAIPKPPMPSGPNFKATSPKAPSFNAYSTPNTYKPPASSGTSPLFKPSSSPQPASSPQVTTAKVPSQKTALPIDPSRTPHCHNCNEEIRYPFFIV